MPNKIQNMPDSVQEVTTVCRVCCPVAVAGGGSWLHMLLIALGETTNGNWYLSTLQLQLASFEVCVACRRLRTLRVTVDRRMPLSLWGDDDVVQDDAKAPKRRRLPSLRAYAVSWKMPDGMLAPVLMEAALLREVTWMQVTGVNCKHLDAENAAVSLLKGSILKPASAIGHSPRSYFKAISALFDTGVAVNTVQYVCSKSWPPALRQLSLGCLRQERINWAVLPSSLQRLAVGGYFNQPLEFASWPVSLKHLTLGGCFNQPMAEALLPSHLLKLTLGNNFNQSIVNVAWPRSLLQLTLGDAFDQPIDDVVWPDSLLKLRFGSYFNQEIMNVAWPESLRGLIFGHHFDKQIIDVMWPDCLNRLEFGQDFNQPIAEVVWPIALRSLVFGMEFDQSVEDVDWPASLRWPVLNDTIGAEQAKWIDWPPTLELLIFRNPLFKDEGPGWPLGKDDFDNPLAIELRDL